MRIGHSLRTVLQSAMLLLPGLLLLLATPSGGAHPVLMSHVRHEAHVEIDPVNIDITLRLTLHEVSALAERRRMDTDGDGVISTGERDRYLVAMHALIRDGLILVVDGRPVRAIPLYEPRVDLLGVKQVTPGHILLETVHFARTPDWLRPGSEIRLADRFWPQNPSIATVEAVGRDGVELEVDRTRGATAPSPTVIGKLPAVGAPHARTTDAYRPIRCLVMSVAGEEADDRSEIAPPIGSSVETAAGAGPGPVDTTLALLAATLVVALAGAIGWRCHRREERIDR